MALSKSESRLLQRLVYELDSRTLKRAGFEMHIVINHDHHDQAFNGPYYLVFPNNEEHKIGYQDADGNIVIVEGAEVNTVDCMLHEHNPYAEVEDASYATFSNGDGAISSEYYYFCYDAKKIDSPFPSVEGYLELLKLALRMVRRRYLIFCNAKSTRSNKEKLAKLPWSRASKFWFALKNRILFSDKTHSMESDLEFVTDVGCKLWKQNQDLDQLACLVSI